MGLGFGIDIGGTGIKGGVVDLDQGVLAGERIRYDTPRPATTEAVLGVIEQMLADADWRGPVGCAFPGIVRNGVIGLAANMDPEWFGVDLGSVLAERIGQRVSILNDADAAGLAEMEFGAGRGHQGVVMVLTLGTGIGSALFSDGVLVPNTELGHLELDGVVAETRAATSARDRENMEYEVWATERLRPYFAHVERLFSPDLFIVGGGVSKKAERFLHLIDVKAPVVPAALRNQSGIVGAAVRGAQS